MVQNALEIADRLCRMFEGFSPSPYICPAGVPTIGYGTTQYPDGRKVKLTDPAINREIAGKYLEYELNKSLTSVIRLCPVLINNPAGMGAITDFVYNLGAGRLQCSTLRRRINQQNWQESKLELMRWVRGGGKVLPGLVLRRKMEADYFM